MEPDTGKLRALVTSPAYDNNLFAAGISRRDWEALRTSKRYPLQNRVIQSVYPPGSVWKLLMAVFFLENGVDPRETVFCGGQTKLGNQIFRCWRRGGHGSQTLEQSLINSCDVYYYIMAERLGIDKISAFAKQCGFGRPTGGPAPRTFGPGALARLEAALPQAGLGARRYVQHLHRSGLHPGHAHPDGRLCVGHAQAAATCSSPSCWKMPPARCAAASPAELGHLRFVVQAMRRTAGAAPPRWWAATMPTWAARPVRPR